MKRLFRLLGAYRLFFLAVLGVAIAGVLELVKQSMAVHWVLGTVCIVEVIPLLVGMWRDIRAGTYGVDILAATAIVVAVVLQQYWAAIVIVIMLTGGKSLEDFAAHRARSELRALLRRKPEHAHLLRKGKTIDVKASTVAARDKVVIRPGEVVPVDAIILDGTGAFDESSLTGESLPQTKDVGDQILSGSISIDGVITAQALHSAHDSQYQQIIRLVRGAAENPAPFVRIADRYSIPFTAVAYGIAGIAWATSHEPIRFLEVIVVATPCPLILAAPIALIAGMSRAAKDGIIIKTGAALELLAQAKTFAFDKTGTLTHGKPEVDAVVVFKPFTHSQVLSAAAGLEQSSNHVLAAAIIAAARTAKLKPVKAKHVKEIAGLGLEAHVGKHAIVVGRSNFMRARNITPPKGFRYAGISQTATYVAISGTLAGYVTFRDSIRSDAKSTLEALKRFRIVKTLMITGDNRFAARSIAQQVGVTDVRAEALPGDKLHAIEALAERPVAFVGDGVNDAPVLMAADVGIALGARGSTAASESADVVIMQDSLAHVARAVAISRRAFRIATESVLVGIGLSVGLMVIFATGKFSPVTGAAVQEVVDVIVIFNALRAHSAKYSYGKKN